jgi:S1-C subfamily serine protease
MPLCNSDKPPADPVPCAFPSAPFGDDKPLLFVKLPRGGIQTGDILMSINNVPIRNYGDMLDATYYLTGEKPLTIQVIRGTQIVESKGIIPTQDPR